MCSRTTCAGALALDKSELSWDLPFINCVAFGKLTFLSFCFFIYTTGLVMPTSNACHED